MESVMPPKKLLRQIDPFVQVHIRACTLDYHYVASLQQLRGFAARKMWTCTCRKGPASVTKYMYVVALFMGGDTSHVVILTRSQKVHVMALREHLSER